MPIFWPQTNKTAKEFQIRLLTDFIFASFSFKNDWQVTSILLQVTVDF